MREVLRMKLREEGTLTLSLNLMIQSDKGGFEGALANRNTKVDFKSKSDFIVAPSLILGGGVLAPIRGR